MILLPHTKEAKPAGVGCMTHFKSFTNAKDDTEATVDSGLGLAGNELLGLLASCILFLATHWTEFHGIHHPTP